MTKKKPVKVYGKVKHSLDVNRGGRRTKSGRSAATVRRVKMYTNRPKRDRKGKVLNHELQSKELPSTRIQPDQRYFGNSRVIDQKQLQIFREALHSRISCSYNVISKDTKLPVSLLNDHRKGWEHNGMTASKMVFDASQTKYSDCGSTAQNRKRRNRGAKRRRPGGKSR
ncbi:unnamed protein product [Cuscuta epithymum]|uniref:Nucleolar GTP-binding protein 2 N-terminal domain-containing protein n=1 Tax=Cuscuta epithymum TaxID=186058 RepID=A0AAV0E8P2_9ASTE|nr:unnamed protein product [Cuscuta epithymum]